MPLRAAHSTTQTSASWTWWRCCTRRGRGRRWLCPAAPSSPVGGIARPRAGRPRRSAGGEGRPPRAGVRLLRAPPLPLLRCAPGLRREAPSPCALELVRVRLRSRRLHHRRSVRLGRRSSALRAWSRIPRDCPLSLRGRSRACARGCATEVQFDLVGARRPLSVTVGQPSGGGRARAALVSSSRRARTVTRRGSCPSCSCGLLRSPPSRLPRLRSSDAHRRRREQTLRASSPGPSWGPLASAVSL